MNNMLYDDEKKKYRPRYFKMLKTMGWHVTYDDLPEIDSPILDVSVFLTKTEKDEKTGKKVTKYGFFQTSYNSNVSYNAFAEAWSAPDEKMAILVDHVHSQIYPFDLDDVVAQLLHLGHHIQDVYKVDKNGKLNLHLTPDIIHELIHQFCTQNSPLLDPTSAPRPHKIMQRKAVRYENPDIVRIIKQDKHEI